MKGTSRATTCDSFGTYHFYNMPIGSYVIEISFIGYGSAEIPAEVKENETRTLFSYLTSTTLELSQILIQSREDNTLSTISRVDLLLKPIAKSPDLLRSVPGLFIAQHAGGGKAEQIFLRGFDIDHGTDISLNVDGMPVNMVSHAHGQGYSDLHFIIPETVGKFSFGKGPYDPRYGNFSTAGYAGFYTLNGIDESLLKLEVGRFNSYRSLIMLDLLSESAKKKKQGAYLASEYSFTNGFFENPQNLRRLNLFGKYHGALSDDKMLSVSLSTFASTWDASGQIPARSVAAGLSRFGSIDPTEGGKTSRTNLNVQLVKDLPGDAVLTHQSYFTRYDFELYSNFTFFLHDNVNGDQIRQKESRHLLGYSTSYSKTFLVGKSQVRTEAGGGLRFDGVAEAELSRTKSRSITMAKIKNGDIAETNAYAYLDGTWESSSAFSLNAALRYDQFLFNYTDNLDTVFSRKATSKDVFSPKLAMQYTLNTGVQLYFKTGVSFHSNDTRVAVAMNGNDILPKAYGVDFGATFKPQNKLLINTAIWILDLDNEFVYVGDEGIVESAGKTRRYGFDLSARMQLTPWLYTDVDLNLSKPRLRQGRAGENYIPLAPLATSSGGLTFKTEKNFNGSLRYRYLSDRPANETYSKLATGYNIVDLVLRYTRSNFDFMVSVENLFNVEWNEAQFDTLSKLKHETEAVSEIHFTPGTPLFVRAGVGYKF